MQDELETLRGQLYQITKSRGNRMKEEVTEPRSERLTEMGFLLEVAFELGFEA